MSYSWIIPSHSKKNRHPIVHRCLSHLLGFCISLIKRHWNRTRRCLDREVKPRWTVNTKPTWVNWRDEKWNINLKTPVVISSLLAYWPGHLTLYNPFTTLNVRLNVFLVRVKRFYLAHCDNANKSLISRVLNREAPGVAGTTTAEQSTLQSCFKSFTGFVWSYRGSTVYFRRLETAKHLNQSGLSCHSREWE